MLPRLEIYRDKLACNVQSLRALCTDFGLEITGVTKAFAGDENIARIFTENGIRRLGDSRLENLARLQGLDCEKWLIRMPGIHRAKETVLLSDLSLNSELSGLAALEAACEALGKSHQIILMLDLGDLREGYVSADDLKAAADFVHGSKHLSLSGIGTNLSCLSFVHPDQEKLSQLVRLGQEIGAPGLVSGGNSASLDLMLRGGFPAGVTNLRLGESLLFGRERANYRYLPGTHKDTFLLKAEILELKDKPSLPWGSFGADSYGNRPVFTDKGIRKRAVCALGRQDTDIETMWPTDPGAEIIGASSDLLVVDVSEAEKSYRPGDAMEFRLGYMALMRAYTSPYITKAYR